VFVRMVMMVCAVGIASEAAAASGTVCRMSMGADLAPAPDLGLPPGHVTALTTLCGEVQALLRKRPGLMAEGPVELQVVRASATGLTLRLARQTGDRTVEGKPLDISSTDSTQFSVPALGRLAALLVEHGPFTAAD